MFRAPIVLAFAFAVASSPAVATETVLTLDPSSTELTFTLDSALHRVEGRFFLQEGEVRFDPETGAAAGRLVVDARRGETGNGSRDRKMHRKVLESERFTTIVFVPERFEGELPVSGKGEVRLSGTMAIHGDRHPMTLVAEVERQGDHVRTATGFTIPYVEWGMPDPSLFLLRVDKEVEVRVRAEGDLAPGEAAATAQP